MTRSVPLTWQDQAILDLESASDPWNIQFEIGAVGQLDADKLREAVLTACRRHPLARARMARGAIHEITNKWEIVDDVTVGPIPVVECTDDELAEVRTAFYSPRIELDVAPPFRVQIARRPRGDLMMVDAAHSAVDGVGIRRLVLSITRAYREQDDPADPIDLEKARDFKKVLASGGWRETAARALEGGRKMKDALTPPARIAHDSSTKRSGSGFAHRALTPAQSAHVNKRRPEGTTINDLLLAAVSLTIEQWNGEHAEDADKIMLFMPVNVRPAEWSTEVVSNLFSYVSLTTMSAERRTLAAAATTISQQTAPLQRAARSGGTQDLLRLIAPVPLGVKRALPHLLTLTGNRFVDTAVVSNLGRAAVLPSFEGDQPHELYFTPPYWSAAAVAVGAASASGSLLIGVRFRLTTLDVEAGERFTDMLVSTLVD